MVDVDLYEVLDVAPDASAAEIKEAYRKAVRTAHPDAGGTAGMFRLVTQAYDTLSNPSTRAEYDAELRGAKRGGVDSSPSGGQEGAAPSADWNVEPEWGEEVSTASDDDRFGGRQTRFRKWAVSAAADVYLKVSWVIVVASYALLSTVLVMTPDSLRPDRARDDAFSWSTQHWWATLIAVAIYVFFTYPTGRSIGGMAMWRWFGASLLIAWVLAYSGLATASDFLIYVSVVLIWVMHHAATILINEVGEARHLAMGEG